MSSSRPIKLGGLIVGAGSSSFNESYPFSAPLAQSVAGLSFLSLLVAGLQVTLD